MNPGWMVSINNTGFQIISTYMSLLWQSSIILGSVSILSYCLRNKNASLRYFLWLTAILVVPVLPLLEWGISEIGAPQKEITVIPVYSIPIDPSLKQQTNLPDMSGNNEAHDIQDANNTESLSVESNNLQITSEIESESMRLTITGYPWALVFIGYSMIVFLLLLWILIGRLRLRNLIINGQAVVDTKVMDIFQRVKEKMKLKKDIIIIESNNVHAPLTYRIFHPVVILPRGFSEKLHESELYAVAVHELMHVKRHDIFMLTITAVIRAVLFFQPLIWLAVREISILAENQCDNAVLAWTSEPVSYTELLIRIAQNLPRRVLSIELASGIITSKNAFYRRVEAILAEHQDKIKRISRLALSGIVTAAVLSLVVALLFPLGYAQEPKDEIIISGKVMYNDEPVPGAEIYQQRYLSEKDEIITEKVTESKRDGSFSFSLDPSDDNQTIIAYSPKYSLGCIPLRFILNHRDSTIILDNPAAISGYVKNSNGVPIENAVITTREIEANYYYSIEYPLMVLFIEIITNYDRSLPGLTVVTDSEGFFKFENIPEYSVAQLSVESLGYAKYGRVTIQSGASDILFILKSEGRIEGKALYYTTGEPASTRELLATFTNPSTKYSNFQKTAITDKEGSFLLSQLPAGVYNLSLRTSDVYPEWTPLDIPDIEVREGEITHITDTIRIPNTDTWGIISGTISNNGTDEKVSGITVTAKNAENDYPLMSCITDEQGNYILKAPQGKIKITASTKITLHPDGHKSVGNEEKILDLEEQEIISDVDFSYMVTDLSVNISMFEINIKVIDNMGEILPGALVYISDSDEGRSFPSLFKMDLTDTNGIATFSVIEEGMNLAIQAEHNRLKLKGETEIIVKRDAEIVLSTTPYKTLTVQSRVLDANNQPMPGVMVYVYMKKNNWPSQIYQTLTNDSGEFAVFDLLVGENYSLGIDTEGYEQSTVSLSPLTEDKLPLDDIVLHKIDK